MQNNGIDSDSNGIYLYYYHTGYDMYDSWDVAIDEVDISNNEIDASNESIYIKYEYVAHTMDVSTLSCDATLTIGDHSIYDNTIAGNTDGRT